MTDEIRNNPSSKVSASSQVYPVCPSDEEAAAEESSASTIEKSRAIRPEVIPLMSVPVLVPPTGSCDFFFIESLGGIGVSKESAAYYFIAQGEEIKDNMIKGWMDNLREIEEYVRQLLASPAYQQLQEIYFNGDPNQNAASIQGVSSIGTEGGLLAAFDRCKVLERLPSTAKIAEGEPEGDPSQILTLFLAATILAGGGVALGSEILSSTHPLSGVVEMIEQLQPLFPNLGVQDMIPLINLMAVGPIYFNSWNEAVSNKRDRERKSHIPAIHDFAKDIIKIVSDPNFVCYTLIQRMKGTENLSAEDQDRLSRMLKVVLIGIGLSLLYSVEVGKVQPSHFGGIEPEELRDVLMGKWAPPVDSNNKLTEHERLMISLIARAWEQLSPLSYEDRSRAVEILLSYVGKERPIEPMLDPVKVFDEVVSSSQFNPSQSAGQVKG